MNTELRFKQFAPVSVVIALFYVVVFRLPYETTVVDGQLKLWVRIANGFMSPYILASVALGVIGIMFCLRAKKEKRPIGGLLAASLGYASGALLFLGMVAWWMLSGTLSAIFRAG